MESFSLESSRRLRELAADLDMMLPTTNELADPSSEEYANQTPLDTVEEQRLGLSAGDARQPLPQGRISEGGASLAGGLASLSLSSRPPLRREGSVPAPSQPPPPAPAPPSDNGDFNGMGSATDSLSLMQLRRLVTEMPRVEPTPYAFVYTDAASLPEELEEWFAYSVEERARILKAQSSFATEWGAHNNWVFTGDDEGALDWMKTSPEKRRDFMRKLLAGLEEPDLDKRLRQLEALVYLVLGCWHETAGVQTSNGSPIDSPMAKVKGKEKATEPDVNDVDDPNISAEAQRMKTIRAHFSKSALQLEWIGRNVFMLFEIKGLQLLFDAVRTTCLRECTPDPSKLDGNAVQKEAEQRETWCALTVLYTCLEVARACEDEAQRISLRAGILSLDPNMLIFLGEIINKLRWDNSIQGVLQRRDPREPNAEKGPSAKLLLLTWKAVLVSLGGLDEVEKAKDSFREDTVEDKNCKGPLITASPLDYHTFRQEISSKYPAYNPPKSYFPMEPDQKSILPPLRVNPTKPMSTIPSPPSQHGTSILHQPVHIATPAPSPPPSPQVGKGGKKQNYQTNNLFPFLYPPLDETSNQIGGKGSTDLQDVLVGRKWQGSDIPTSILEAAELFSKRMRATRALKQLWAERVEFMKYERGWTDVEGEELPKLDLDGEVEEILQDSLESRINDGSTQERLRAVDNFYADGLPHLQSIVMVLMKTILANVTSLITQASGQAGVQSGFHFQDNQNGNQAQRNGEGNGTTNANGFHLDISNLAPDELDKMRGEEIAAKAVTGLLVLLLKWFKVSHVLKFEYLTQLLVDANYIPMVLKLLQTQEIERIVNYKCEREDLNFFHYCRAHSRVGLQDTTSDDSSHYGPLNPTEMDIDDDSDDECAPPPIIKRRRSPDPSPTDQQQNASNTSLPPPTAFPPQVDELGIPTSALPTVPITTYSWRNFFSSINYLRILQKVCKGKAHRNLMLITYKSATHLKKSLRVPQPSLRLYTLKLFKNQVPYCGRKWRQSNMRVITAVYLHCRPELRDDWLCNGDVDSDVEQSVPLEQSLRALTHWYNLRNWPVQMGAQRGVLDEEMDFFARELEKMDWGTLGEGEMDDLGMGTTELPGGEWSGMGAGFEGGFVG